MLVVDAFVIVGISAFASGGFGLVAGFERLVDVSQRFHLGRDERRIWLIVEIAGRTRGSDPVDQRMPNQPGRLDLGLHGLHRRRGLVCDPQAGAFRRSACLRDRIDEILHRCIKRLLRDRQRLEQPVAARAELLHLGSPRLPLASQVAQHPLANSLRLIDHVAASLAPVLGDLLGVTLCRSKGLLSGGDGLRPGRVGGSERLGPDCLGLSFGPFGAFGGGSVRRLEHLGRLGAERFRNPMSL